MKKKIAQKWAAALRSGKYRQAKGALCAADDAGYCCLGVLCELYREETQKGQWISRAFDVGGNRWAFKLPQSVAAWAGVRSAVGMYRETSSLMEDNDQGKTFAEIADIIEKYVEEL
jgi:hypothetical protein